MGEGLDVQSLVSTDVAQLRENELFAALTNEELTEIAPFCSEFAVIEDGLLFSEGREASHLYLVTKGQIALRKAIRVPHGKTMRRTTIMVCRSGEAVGLSALVEPHKYILSAMAWESSRLIRVDSKRLRKTMDMYPQVGYKVMRSLSVTMTRRLRQTTEALITEREVSLAGLKL